MIVATKLKPCRPESLRPGDAPALPAWFPLDRKPTDEDPAPAPYTEGQRRELRDGRAIAEAIEGPYDGQRGQVAFRKGTEPPAVLYYADGHVGYRLDREDSTRKVLIYRYSPRDSLSHRATIAVVEQVFHDHGQQYADEARQGERQDHPGGEAFGA